MPLLLSEEALESAIFLENLVDLNFKLATYRSELVDICRLIFLGSRFFDLFHKLPIFFLEDVDPEKERLDLIGLGDHCRLILIVFA